MEPPRPLGSKFNLEQIDEFSRRWFDELLARKWMGSDDANRKAESLRQAARWRDLSSLASEPLLLTMMAMLLRTGSLPDDRSDLYRRIVDQLLHGWEESKREESKEKDVSLDLLRNRDQMKALMSHVAFEAHAGHVGREGAADIKESVLLKTIALHVQRDLGLAQRVVDHFENRTGLLLGQGAMDERQFTFPHRTFQEYLAGFFLERHPRFQDEACRVAGENPGHWRVPLVFAAKCAGTARAISLADALVHTRNPEEYEALKGAIGEKDWHAALVAGEQIKEMGSTIVSEADRTRADRVRAWLKALLTRPALTREMRVDAAELLGELGVCRFRSSAGFLPDEPLLGFVEIPAGLFLMGTPQEDVPKLIREYGGQTEWYERETPQRRMELPKYYIARYPVTVAQFRTFVQTTGFDLSNKDALHGESHAPVVLINWHEAWAYCDWLTGQLSQWSDPLAGLIRDEGWRVALPSEAEWEKAARGTGGRTFPWEGPWVEGRANAGETGIGSVSPVGAFPGDASEYGAMDMAGNVSEWCRSRYRPHSKPTKDSREHRKSDGARVVRGGAFDFNAWFARCAFRDGYVLPDNRYGNLGFRVVVVPRLSSCPPDL